MVKSVCGSVTPRVSHWRLKVYSAFLYFVRFKLTFSFIPEIPSNGNRHLYCFRGILVISSHYYVIALPGVWLSVGNLHPCLFPSPHLAAKIGLHLLFSKPLPSLLENRDPSQSAISISRSASSGSAARLTLPIAWLHRFRRRMDLRRIPLALPGRPIRAIRDRDPLSAGFT